MTEQPLLFIEIVELPTGKTETRIYGGNLTAAKAGLLMCDTVRHLAKALKVDEDEIWMWLDAERNHPTSPITEVKPN